MTPEKPFQYQTIVRDAILSGRDIVLQAPTGAGKTRAAVEPALRGFRIDADRRSHDHPPRLLLLEPMRTLTAGALKSLRKSYTERAWDHAWAPRIQSGDQPDDPLFEGKVIVATVDQMLASLLALPYGLPRRLDNINAGAMIGAYLIFDEFHLYPRHEMMLTVLAMLRLLKGISRFTLMSATFSAVFLQAIAAELDADFIGDVPGAGGDTLFADVTSVQTQQRTWRVMAERLDAEAVVRLHGMRTLVVCNVVARARALFVAVREALPDVTVILLHSQFFASDRRAIQDRLLDLFERDDQPPECPIIVIATQVVEVGLDISADVLLTECAPAASLIQRAGRCARREKQSGTVIVFQPFDEDGQVSYAPYSKDDAEKGEGLETVCARTWETLASDAFNGQVIRFAEEQRLVDQAHGAHDAAFVHGLREKLDERTKDIVRCWSERSDGDLTELVRKVATVPLFIHPQPQGSTIRAAGDAQAEVGLTERPFQFETLSLSRAQIYRLIKTRHDAFPDETSPIFGCDGRDVSADKSDDAMSEGRFIWRPVQSEKDAYALAWFAVTPDAVGYDADTGFGMEVTAVPASVSPATIDRVRPNTAYRADTYVEHINGLFHAYTRPAHVRRPGHAIADSYPLRDELLYPLRQVCAAAGENAILGERMLRLAIALHDVGKLNRRWQAWAGAWQDNYAAHIGTPTRSRHDGPLAHTDFDRRDDTQRALMKTFSHAPRGTHAVESANACLPAIVSASERNKRWCAVTTLAIMHHHSPDAAVSNAFAMVDYADEAVIETLTRCGFAEEEAQSWLKVLDRRFEISSQRLNELAKSIAPTQREWRAMLLYLLFVRVLRLADQRSSSVMGNMLEEGSTR